MRFSTAQGITNADRLKREPAPGLLRVPALLALLNLNGEPDASPRFAGRLDGPAVELHDPFDDGEPQPGAAAVPGLIRPVKAVKNMGQVLFPDPDAVVLDGQKDVSILFQRADRDGAACLSILDLPFSTRFSSSWVIRLWSAES